ncbi:MAG: cadherin-like beta sandwich domain-containing protein [Lachnospiraceae bacterium]|nr:cadherin-like beta sandwich domain-containing protein [Lachnospiraceae bacterium]
MSRKNICDIFGKGAILTLAVTGLTLTLNAISAFAAGTVSVTASGQSAGVSEQVTFSVQTSEPEDPGTPPTISISYDPALLQFSSCDVEYGGGEGGLVTMTGTGGNITFTALAEGNATVSAEAIIDGDGNNPATGSASVSVGAAGTGDAGTSLAAAAPAANTEGAGSKATLKALEIQPGILTPAFTPENTEYTITVDPSVTDITVSGGVSESDSQITSASGFKGLDDESKDAQITITAADGSTLTYHFTIVRGDTSAAEAAAAQPDETVAVPGADTAATDSTAAGSTVTTGTDTGSSGGFLAGAGIGGGSKGSGMTILVGQNSYTIQPTFDDSLLPSGSSKTTITYAGETVEAAVLAEGGMTVLCATSNIDNTPKLFLYDAASEGFQGFVRIASANGGFIIPTVLPSSLPKGFVVEGCEIGGSYVACGKLKDATAQQRENVCLLYAFDQDGGQDYYLYDLLGGGYVHFLNTGSGASSGMFSKRAIAIMVVLGVALFVSLIIILVMALQRGEDVTLRYDDFDDMNYPPEKDNYDDQADDLDMPRKKKKKKTILPEEDFSEDSYPEEEPEPVRPKSVKKKRPVREEESFDIEPLPDEDEDMKIAPDRGAKSEMPVSTVKRVKKKAPVKLPEEMESDGFDIDSEIKSMTENAVKRSQTARMADVDAALKARSTTRTVMPEKDPAARPRKQTRPRSEEITIDSVPKKPAAKTADGRPKVTKKVTDKGVTYTTGKIPITVVQPEISKGQQSNVPIFTLGEEGPSSVRSAQDESGQDTDFEFDYLNVDNKK